MYSLHSSTTPPLAPTPQSSHSTHSILTPLYPYPHSTLTPTQSLYTHSTLCPHHTPTLPRPHTTQDHCCIIHTVVGWHARIGKWTRVEGTPSDLNPNKAFAKVAVQDLFNSEGCLNPAITVIGLCFSWSVHVLPR